mgnify:CR=1 FL=1
MNKSEMSTRKNILIVDDDERNTYALRSYLEFYNMDITIARDGSEAIGKLRQGLKPDVILLDMMMPVMDGYETLEALQADANLRVIPVIAVTAKAMKGDAEKCLAAGAWDYLAKPLDLNALIDKISNIT